MQTRIKATVSFTVATIVVFSFLFTYFSGEKGRRFLASIDEPVKYKSVMVFPGGGLQSTIFLGMLAALEDRGKRPDIIIGTCGGSIAAVIAATVPASERREFVLSKEYYNLYRGLSLNNPSIMNALGTVGSSLARRITDDQSFPDVFKNYILKVEKQIPVPNPKGGFEGNLYRLAIVAAEANFGPEDIGKDGGKARYRETVFTDEKTASLIRGMKAGIHFSPAGEDSYVMPYVEVDTDQTLTDASRASISDPYYIKPHQIGKRYFLTGAVDLYPIELAHRIATEVIFPFPGRFDTLVEQNVMNSTFGFDNNERLSMVTESNATHWVDISDTDTVYAIAGMNPKPDLSAFAITSRVPDKYPEFRRKAEILYMYGYSRMKEALARFPGTKAHIRIFKQPAMNWTPSP